MLSTEHPAGDTRFYYYVILVVCHVTEICIGKIFDPPLFFGLTPCCGKPIQPCIQANPTVLFGSFCWLFVDLSWFYILHLNCVIEVAENDLILEKLHNFYLQNDRLMAIYLPV